MTKTAKAATNACAARFGSVRLQEPLFPLPRFHVSVQVRLHQGNAMQYTIAVATGISPLCPRNATIASGRAAIATQLQNRSPNGRKVSAPDHDRQPTSIKVVPTPDAMAATANRIP